MENETKQEKSERLIQEAIKKRGYIFPEWEFVARMDPDFFESYNNLYNASLGKSGALGIKVKEFVSLAILAYRRVPTDVLVSHIKRAYDHGATKEEILEVFESTVASGGSPTFFNGLKALLDMEKKSSS